MHTYTYTGSGWLDSAWRILTHATYHAARAERLRRAGQIESAEQAHLHAQAIQAEGEADIAAFVSRYRAVLRPRTV